MLNSESSALRTQLRSTLEERARIKKIDELLPKYFLLNGLSCDGDTARCLSNLFEMGKVKTLVFPPPEPSPVTWTEDDIQYSLRQASLGFFTVRTNPNQAPLAPGVYPTKAEDFNVPSIKLPYGSYREGQEIYALALDFSIKVGKWGGHVPFDIKRVVDRNGKLLEPNSLRLTYQDKGMVPTFSELSHNMVWFVVSPKEREFLLITGGKSKLYFEIFVEDTGQLTARMATRTKL
ncbi:MAG: hypothetical protein J5J00_00700 [Deltaproteobacteria bacterium]|nr:hypothetical protein [Deltaproteobacteria bacterium]